MTTPTPIADYQCDTGENPIWHEGEKRLYWLDIPRGQIYRYDPATGQHEQSHEGDVIGGMTIQEDGNLLTFGVNGRITLLHPDGEIVFKEELPGEQGYRFNDVIADPAGRVFCGTFEYKKRGPGRLYRLEHDGTAIQELDGIGCSNGIGFSPDLSIMYYTDSVKREIYRFDYDVETGRITNQFVWVTVPEGEGLPDGLTVDAEGYVWSARWDGSRLVRYTPTGIVERQIDFPTALKVSSVVFGGSDYTDMYITTAGGQDKAKNGPDAGALFHLNLGIKGKPEFRSKIRI